MLNYKEKVMCAEYLSFAIFYQFALSHTGNVIMFSIHSFIFWSGKKYLKENLFLREKTFSAKFGCWRIIRKNCSHQNEGGTISQRLIHTICKVEEKVFVQRKKMRWNQSNFINVRTTATSLIWIILDFYVFKSENNNPFWLLYFLFL